jgi:uncharacterized protein (TIGR02266 family)
MNTVSARQRVAIARILPTVVEVAERESFSEAQSFERLRGRLRAVADARPPSFDPRALALRGILATDRLAQTDLVRKVDALGQAGVYDPHTLDGLRMAARALLHVVSWRGDPAAGRDSSAAVVARAEARALMRTGMQALEALDVEEVRLWLDVFRLPSEGMNLVYDLRALAGLYEDHGSALVGLHPVAAAATARRRADSYEAQLLGRPQDEEWTPWLDRAFSLTLSLYAEACRIGRFLATSGATTVFPSAAGIARAARRGSPVVSGERPIRRGPPSLPPSSLPEAEAVQELAFEADVVPDSATAISGDCEVVAHLAPPPLPPPQDPVPESARSQRAANRRNIELEVSLMSESNFYVGFTENLSETGVFVATYLARPLGSKVEMSVRILGRDEPIALRGEVRWIREYSPTSDGCPGMGIRFDAISDEYRAEIAQFLGRRDPLFFVE